MPQKSLSQSGNISKECVELSKSLANCDKSDSFKSLLLADYLKKNNDQKELINIRVKQIYNQDSVIVQRNKRLEISEKEIKTWTNRHVRLQSNLKYYVIFGTAIGVASRFIKLN